MKFELIKSYVVVALWNLYAWTMVALAVAAFIFAGINIGFLPTLGWVTLLVVIFYVGSNYDSAKRYIKERNSDKSS